MSASPTSYFHRKQKEREPKELTSCTLPLLLIAYTSTSQFEILATTLQGFVKTLQRVAKFLVSVLSKHNHSYRLFFFHCFEFILFFGLKWWPNDNYQESGTILRVHYASAMTWHTDEVEGILNECSTVTNSLRNLTCNFQNLNFLLLRNLIIQSKDYTAYYIQVSYIYYICHIIYR